MDGGAGRARAPACRVPGCQAQLASGYSQKYRVCIAHKGASCLDMGDGTQSRFCQQCSQIHPLDAFDGSRSSCREGLARHTKRRRLRHEQAQQAQQQCRVAQRAKRARVAEEAAQPSEAWAEGATGWQQNQQQCTSQPDPRHAGQQQQQQQQLSRPGAAAAWMPSLLPGAADNWPAASPFQLAPLTPLPSTQNSVTGSELSVSAAVLPAVPVPPSKEPLLLHLLCLALQQRQQEQQQQQECLAAAAQRQRRQQQLQQEQQRQQEQQEQQQRLLNSAASQLWGWLEPAPLAPPRDGTGGSSSGCASVPATSNLGLGLGLSLSLSICRSLSSQGSLPPPPAVPSGRPGTGAFQKWRPAP